MKKITFTLLLFSLFFSVTAQEVEVSETQLSMITKRTATWCPLCGGWGWTFFEGLVEDNSERALLIAAHYSGDLINQASLDITNNLGGFSQPRYYFNNDDQGANSSNFGTKREEIKTQVNDAYASSPVAQSGIILVDDETELSVYTKTKFFQPASGEYYLSVFLIEKYVNETQAGQNGLVDHPQILRRSLLSTTFGDQIGEGDIAAGTEVELNTTLAIDGTYDLENIQIATVIWEKVDDKYNFVNTFFTSEILEEVVSTNETQIEGAELKIAPNPVVNQSFVDLNLDRGFEQSELLIFDVLGRKTTSVFNGQLPAGLHRFPVSKESLGSSGLYFVQFRSGNQLISRRLLIQ